MYRNAGCWSRCAGAVTGRPRCGANAANTRSRSSAASGTPSSACASTAARASCSIAVAASSCARASPGRRAPGASRPWRSATATARARVRRLAAWAPRRACNSPSQSCANRCIGASAGTLCRLISAASNSPAAASVAPSWKRSAAESGRTARPRCAHACACASAPCWRARAASQASVASWPGSPSSTDAATDAAVASSPRAIAARSCASSSGAVTASEPFVACAGSWHGGIAFRGSCRADQRTGVVSARSSSSSSLSSRRNSSARSAPSMSPSRLRSNASASGATSS